MQKIGRTLTKKRNDNRNTNHTRNHYSHTERGQMKYTKQQVIDMIEKAVKMESDEWDSRKEKTDAMYYGEYIKQKVEKMMKE